MEQWEKDSLKRVDGCLIGAIIVIIAVCVGFFIGRNSVKVTPPVEEIIQADSLIKVNDSIKVTINNLDSIKNARIIEIQTLDDDSTLKLFYELISW